MEAEGAGPKAGSKSSKRRMAGAVTDILTIPLQAAAAVIAMLHMTTRDALAYSDPGSGALLWQMIVASMFGGVFYLRKLVNTIRCRRRKEGEAAGRDDKAGSEG